MEKEILNMEEAAELFGVSVKTFIKLLKEERVPARKIGREWRFSRTALINWLSSGDSMKYSSSEIETKEFFDQIAENWEDIRKNYYDESIKNKLLSLNILKKDMTVVDLGAGDGYYSLSIASKVKKVLSVDISIKMLNKLKKNSIKVGIKNIEIVESDVKDLPFEPNSIDFVCTNMCLHHIENYQKVIEEIYRILKVSGKVCISDFVEHQNYKLTDEMHDFWKGFSKKEIINILENCGFKNMEYKVINENEKEKEKIFMLLAEK